jgi:hypothetical protein
MSVCTASTGRGTQLPPGGGSMRFPAAFASPVADPPRLEGARGSVAIGGVAA